MRSSHLALLVLPLALAACLPAPRGLAPAHPQQARLEGRTSEVGGAVAFTGGLTDGGGIISQISGGVELPLSEAFSMQFGLDLVGIFDHDLSALTHAQASNFVFSIVPFVAPTFYAGPVHIRLTLFALGGGGPTVGGGFYRAGLDLGYHAEDWSAYGGANVWGALGCCNGEYTAMVIQAPLGATYDLHSGEDLELSLGLQAIYTHIDADFRDFADDLEGLTVLLSLIVSRK